MNIIKRTNYPIMFDEFFNDFFNVKEMNIPPYNIMESEDNFQIEFSVPGSNKKDFQIEIENDYLKVSKEKKESNTSHNYSRQQFDYNYFEKSFFLPETIDLNKVSSKYDNGILRIMLPKKNEVIINNKKKLIAVKYIEAGFTRFFYIYQSSLLV